MAEFISLPGANAPQNKANTPDQLGVTPLIIGTVTLQDFELPETLNFQNIQSLAIHEFPGGVRAIQALGAFPQATTWSGILLGANAFTRAATLDALRASGNKQTLSYGPWKQIVVVSRLELQIKYRWYIPYTITVEPIIDQTGSAQQSGTNVPTAETNIFDQVGLINTKASANVANFPTSGLTSATDAAANIYNEIVSNGGLISNVPEPTIQQMIQTNNSVISGFQQYMIPGVGNDTQVSEALNYINMFTIINNMLNQPSTNLTQVTTINPNLFQLAAQYYGDVTRWTDIASYNGLIDPIPTGTFNLFIPQ